MGIYAALYYCGSVGFLQGLRMVRQAWETISQVAADGLFGMGMVIGLTESELSVLLEGMEEVEISNQNNPYTFILSGSRRTVEAVLAAAREEGAMRATLLPVSKPYHSKFLEGASPGYAGAIRALPFKDPEYRYISSMDQHVLTTGEGRRQEARLNLSSRMNWLKTVQCMLASASTLILECGAGDGLTRNARCIGGNFRSFPVDKLETFLEMAGN